MANTYYIKLFCIRTRRHNTILMFLPLLVADTISPKKSYGRIFLINLRNLNCGPYMPKYKSNPVTGLHLVLQIKTFYQYIKKIGKSNLDKVVKRQIYKQTPLGLGNPYVVYSIVS